MKTILLPAICGMLLLATACKKEEKTTEENTTPLLKSFYMKVDGVAYTGLGSSTQHTSGLILFSSFDGTQNFSLRFDDTLAVGTYTMGPNLPVRLVHTDDNYATSYVSDPGTLSIVSHDTVNDRITGTFNCTLVRTSPASTKALTNGEFNIQY